MQNVLAARIVVTLLTFTIFFLYIAAFPIGDWSNGFSTFLPMVAAALLLGCCGVSWTGLSFKGRLWGLLLIGIASTATFANVEWDFLKEITPTMGYEIFSRAVILLVYGLLLLVFGFVWWLAAHPLPRHAGLDREFVSPEQIAAYPLTARSYYRLAARLIIVTISLPLLAWVAFISLIAFGWGGPQWWFIPIILLLLFYPIAMGISCFIGLPIQARQIGLGFQALFCSTLIIAVFALQYDKDGMDSFWYLLPSMVFAMTYAYLWWVATQPRKPLLAPRLPGLE